MQEFGEVTHANLEPNHCFNNLKINSPTNLHLGKHW